MVLTRALRQLERSPHEINVGGRTGNGHEIALGATHETTSEQCGVYDQEQIERFEDTLEDGVQDILRDLQRLTHANMTAEIARFAAALHANVILPEDF